MGSSLRTDISRNMAPRQTPKQVTIAELLVCQSLRLLSLPLVAAMPFSSQEESPCMSDDDDTSFREQWLLENAYYDPVFTNDIYDQCTSAKQMAPSPTDDKRETPAKALDEAVTKADAVQVDGADDPRVVHEMKCQLVEQELAYKNAYWSLLSDTKVAITMGAFLACLSRDWAGTRTLFIGVGRSCEPRRQIRVWRSP